MMNKIEKQNFNYHSHTYRCKHASKTAMDRDYVEAAIRAGYTSMAFTDHIPLREKLDFNDNMRMALSSTNEYIESINKLKKDYEDKIDIKVGFEFEYTPFDEDIKHLLDLKKKTDIMIQGQHFVLDKKEDFVGLNIYTKKKPTDNDLDTYLSYLLLSMDRGIPDIIAHPDIFMVRRSEFGEKEEQITRLICKKAIETNIPLEINLGRIGANYILQLNGKKYSQQIKYPCKEFWNIVAEESEASLKSGGMPVKVLFGKDCHDPRQYEYNDDYKIAIDIIGNDIIDRLYFVDDKFNFVKNFKKFDLEYIEKLVNSYGINVFRKEAYDILANAVIMNDDEIDDKCKDIATEISGVFKNMDSNIIKRIPNILITYFNKVKNNEYKFDVNNKLSNMTIGLLSLIYQNYILDELKKAEYIDRIATLPNIYEVMDDGGIVNNEKMDEVVDETKLPVKYKENFVKRFFNKIKSFFFSKVA